VVALVALLAWLLWTESTARDVYSRWTLRCGDTQVGTHEGEPAILGHEGWRCTVEVTVHNDSSHAVHITAVEAPLLGSEGGNEIRAVPIDNGTVGKVVDDTSEAGAHWPTGIDVEPDESARLDLVVGWRAEGCNDGGWYSLVRFPVLRVQVLGRTVRVPSAQDLTVRAFSDPHDAVACRP